MQLDPTFLKARIGFEKAIRLEKPTGIPGVHEGGGVVREPHTVPRNGKRKLKKLERQNGVLIKLFARQYRRLRRLMDEQARVFAVLSAG
jgi:hypothetical protein